MRKLWAGFLSRNAAAGAHNYIEGQVWTYRTRPGEESSTVQINKIERNAKLENIFHISVFDVRLNNPHAPGELVTELPHFPVSRESLDKSVLKLAGAPPRQVAYEEGYAEWKRAFDAGQAGIFTISVAEIVSSVERAISGIPQQ